MTAEEKEGLKDVLQQVESVLIGLRYSEAIKELEAAGWKHRIASSDGSPFVHTRDFKPDRVNLHLVGDVVAKISIG